MNAPQLNLQSITGVDVQLRIAGPGSRSCAFVIDWHFRILLALAWLLLASFAYFGQFTLFNPEAEDDAGTGYALIVGLPDGMTPASAECSGYFDMLARLGADGRLAGKAAAAVGSGATVDAIAGALSAAGLTVVTGDPRSTGDGTEAAIALGRRVVAAAESQRRAPS